MEDVIFAGTAGRPPLGRAEVTLTIDNSDGALPIEYTEVSITRRMYRSGESEYEINGDKCRLLDIQELLSDSGIGREMHVIVGRASSTRSCTPNRRTGGRSSRRRPASSSTASARRRRCASWTRWQANLNRLTDLTAELRRQLKPLGRQAEVARRAAEHPGRPARRPAAAARRRPGHPARRPGQGDRRRDRAAGAAGAVGARVRRGPHGGGGAGGGARRRRPGAGRRPGHLVSSCPRLQERLRATGQLAAERLRHLTAAGGAGAPRAATRTQLDAEAAAGPGAGSGAAGGAGGGRPPGWRRRWPPGRSWSGRWRRPSGS